eukprot:CAMPEP_0182499532 /NCGR_PEP_ID=MMETSP1321-20130603/7807_1 /TAXON_ID=91990 /ORGANISM="Bolidomonas sp., Strain RCC1657" /LENGTH=202 /DNA_ID=CAMNT_0024703751 /DNA_START=24 /DNA_END=632 /DNA_ORIENTATION=-
MKLFVLSLLLAPAGAWVVPSSVRASSSVLNSVKGSGMDNGYVPASAGDGGQGQFGAVSPSDWKTPGTSPAGENSFGKSDGGDEPWFSEAVATVFMETSQQESTYLAFTKEAAEFKMAEFEAASPYDFKNKADAQKELVEKLGGYDQFLDSDNKKLLKTWDMIHPDPVVVAAAAKKAEEAAAKKKADDEKKKAEEEAKKAEAK